MPHIQRPDGTRIYYEVHGRGFPVLLLAPGGVSSQISFWPMSPINPFELATDFMVIGMNQRHADDSPGPLRAPTWDDHAGDQLAVLDAVGVPRAALWGGCIGAAYCLKLVEIAPDRVAGAVCQDAVGIVDGVNDRDTFYAMFKPTVDIALRSGMEAVVHAALRNSVMAFNNDAGPFGPRIASDEAFRRDILRLTPQAYADLIESYDNNIWGGYFPFMSVPDQFVQTISTPLLVLPGNDPFHPTGISERLCEETAHATCLGVNWRDSDHVAETKRRVVDFLHSVSGEYDRSD